MNKDCLNIKPNMSDSIYRYYELYNCIRDGALSFDLDGNVIECNPAFIQMLGYDDQEIAQLNCADIAPYSWENGEKEIISDQVNSRGYSDVYEKEFRTKSGDVIYTEVRTSLIRDRENCPIGYWSIVRDVTEKKKLEAQILLVQKYESLGVLSGGIAHDFNNLLMGILGNAELALMNLSNVSPVREYLKNIEHASGRMSNLCNQLLAYSGKGRYSLEPLDLREIIMEMEHLLEVSVSKRIVLKYKFADNLPRILGDPAQIRQVIMNLVVNASEAISDKSGIVSISAGAMECNNSYLKKIWLDEMLPEGPYVYLEISDTGCGMTSEMKKKIFDPFFSTKFPGRGLGLAAVMGIVRGHKGAIKVYSEYGKGTTFKVLLPALALNNGLEYVSDDEYMRWKGTGTVLLADDEDSVRVIGRQMLEAMGFKVLTALDGLEAIELFSKYSDEIVCVMLDLTMPNLGGDDAFRELRNIREDVKIILSSGYNEREITERFIGKALSGFIQKPYTYERLLETIKKALEQ